ncbi:MAG TPA: HAD family hydrolase [Steroidobacteraceae bacterium]|nr:HAD family hydrolase [Steroidobacteraceae bacterium]
MAAAVLTRLREARAFVFDMDGTLVLGDRRNKGLTALPGAVELLEHLGQRGVPFRLLTNGTAHTPQEYVSTLRELGFPLAEDSVLTPSSVAADYFLRRKLQRVLVLGTRGVSQPLADAGITLVTPSPQAQADAVYVGWHRGFNMDDLDAACNAVWHGAKLFAASLSPFFATADGKALGTSRAISAAITSITGARATALGKPSLEALRNAARHLGVSTQQLAVVGDDPGLEVPMAHRGGALAVAVNTGLGGADAFAHLPPDQRPHLTVHGAAELLELYRGK